GGGEEAGAGGGAARRGLRPRHERPPDAGLTRFLPSLPRDLVRSGEETPPWREVPSAARRRVWRGSALRQAQGPGGLSTPPWREVARRAGGCREVQRTPPPGFAGSPLEGAVSSILLAPSTGSGTVHSGAVGW